MVSTKTDPANTQERKRPSRAFLVIGIAVVALIIGIGGGLIWFFGGEAPDAVDLATTAAAVSETAAASSATETIGGTWSVDTNAGVFSVTEETTATFVGFRVDEVLASIGSTIAVGRTPEVSGNVEIEGTTLVSAEIVVDLTSIVSDESRRGDAIQRSLGTGANPEATFILTEPIDLGEGAAAGDPVSVIAIGELALNGVTNTVEIPIQAQLIDGMVLVTGSTDIVFADYGVSTPTAPAVLSVEDHGILEFQLWLSGGS
jgi:polyisoprenoid-binding protein YceI